MEREEQPKGKIVNTNKTRKERGIGSVDDEGGRKKKREKG